MKSRWWIAVFLLVVLGLQVQPGCGNQADLPMEASPDEPVDDLMDDMEMPAE